MCTEAHELSVFFTNAQYICIVMHIELHVCTVCMSAQFVWFILYLQFVLSEVKLSKEQIITYNTAAHIWYVCTYVCYGSWSGTDIVCAATYFFTHFKVFV